MQKMNIVISGATSGIGFITARELAIQGGNVYIIGRNPEKTRKTAEQISRQTGNGNVFPLIADLSLLKDIRQLGSQVMDSMDHLDVLVNNAGALFMRRELNAEGREMTFALNHLNYFLLTKLLLPLLEKSTSARIVNVSSAAHLNGKIEFDNLQGEKSFTGWNAYSASKLMNVLFTYELARRLDGKITANVLHPGFVASNFGRSNGGLFDPLFKVSHLAAISPEKGAQTSVYLASSKDVEGVTGKYWEKCREIPSSDLSYDTGLARQLWVVSEEIIR
jgi:NAD(P)-dependent dehydrogenase (short-subunit alcohol dehydrogenase family)